MKKAVIISLYFIFFWIVLPFLLIYASNYLDGQLFIKKELGSHWRIIGFFLLIPGISFMILSVRQFYHYGREFPVSYFPPDHIIQKGVYAIWRHPIYLFAFITVAGLALIKLSYAFVTIVLPVFFILISLYIWNEENGLRVHFGEEYSRYKKRVSLIIPRLHQWIKILAFFYFKLRFNICVKGKDKITIVPPFFVVAAHRNYLDPFFISYALPWPIKYISTFEIFRNPVTKRIFTKLGSIPRKRYTKNIKSVRLIIKALEDGHPVGVFPEGGRSWTGKPRSLKSETLEMFLKYRHIPILPVRIEGNYHAWPRWSPRILRARVKVQFEEVLFITDQHTIEKLRADLYNRICPVKDTETEFRCKSISRIRYLSTVLYRCPECKGIGRLQEMAPDKLICRKCGLLMSLDENFYINLELSGKKNKFSIHELYEKIKITSSDLEITQNQKSNDEHVLLTAKVSFYKEQENRFFPVDTGELQMRETALVFMKDKKLSIRIPFRDLGAVTIESYYKLQLYDYSSRNLYQAVFNNDSSLRWQDTLLLLMEQKGYKTPISR